MDKEIKISIETDGYNEKRYGKPWIARVDFSANAKGDFKWGEWIGDPGDAGLLELTVHEGDIVARGQKDTRNTRYSAPNWYQMTNGKLSPIDGRAAALKAFRTNKTAKADAALKALAEQLPEPTTGKEQEQEQQGPTTGR